MADRIIKGDSGNDVVIQNNAGSRKIEVTNSGDVEVTGDVKTTTVKATNLKANDGTAGLVVADSTGEVTSSGGLKATTLKATNIKANDGTASLEIADSTGDVGFSGNTDLKIKLPSSGGIYESDGSTEILKEASGVVTLKNSVLDSTVTFPSGHITRHFYDEINPSSDLTVTTSGAMYSDLELSITNANTSDFLFVNFFLPGFHNQGVANRALGVRARYSTDNFGSNVQFGSNLMVFTRHGQIDAGNSLYLNVTGSIRAQHPATSYKIRLFLISIVGNITLFLNASSNESVGNISAFEIKA